MNLKAHTPCGDASDFADVVHTLAHVVPQPHVVVCEGTG